MTNRHITSDEISRWIAGDRCGKVEKHLQLCPVCKNEVSAFQSALNDFRSAVHGWSDQSRTADTVTIVKVRQQISFHGNSWNWLGFVAATIFICAAIHFNGQRAPERRQADVAKALASDADIMKQVDTELARTVPTSMEPLTRLVSWDEEVTGSAARNGIRPN